MKTTKTQHTKELVERIGVAVEHTGFPPAVGRVLGSLLVAEPPHMTFDELRSFLGISKSAVSNALSVLMSREMVDYITLPGDRKRHFCVAAGGMIAQMKRRLQQRSAVPELLREIVRSRSPRHPEFNQSLHEFTEFVAFMDGEIQGALEKWESSKRKRNQQK